MEVTCEENSTGEGTLIFSHCIESTSSQVKNDFEEREESAFTIYPTMNCETLLEDMIKFGDNSPVSSSNYSKPSRLVRSDFKKGSNRPEPEHDSVEEHSSFIVCQIGGRSSAPKILRIFSNHSKVFMEKIFQNSDVHEIEIVAGNGFMSLDDILSRLLLFGQFDGHSSNRMNIDANTSELDPSFDNDLNSLIDVIEVCEDPPSPIEKKIRKMPLNAAKTTKALKKQTYNKSSKTITSRTSDDTSYFRHSRADKISSQDQSFLKEEKDFNESQMVLEDAQNSSIASVSSKPNRFECDYCHNTFCSKYSVRDHILAKHPPSDNPLDNRAYQCEECTAAFVKKSALNEHVRSLHTTLPKFQCPSCPKKFKKIKYLEYHTLRAHSDTKGYLCQHCGAAFSLIFALNEHVNYYHSGRAFKCNDCNRVYKKANSLIIHSKPRLEGPKPTCRYCKETFINKCSLQSHLQQVHEEMHQFSCQTCDAKFTQRRCLLTHVKHVHQGIRKHPCPLCEKSFKSATGVKVHLNNTHVDEKNFKCALCFHHFKTKQIYNEHMAAKHPM